MKKMIKLNEKTRLELKIWIIRYILRNQKHFDSLSQITELLKKFEYYHIKLYQIKKSEKYHEKSKL